MGQKACQIFTYLIITAFIFLKKEIKGEDFNNCLGSSRKKKQTNVPYDTEVVEDNWRDNEKLFNNNNNKKRVRTFKLTFNSGGVPFFKKNY